MRNVRVKLAAGVAVLGVVGVTGAAIAGGGPGVKAKLRGFEEVPAVSTEASGKFRATLSPGKDSVDFELRYADLEADVTQAHIHFGQFGVNGGIAVFLCSNLPSPPTPPGVQACPPPPAVVTGTFTADDVIGPDEQGIDPGELDELLRAARAGVTYANVHSTKFPAGEVRGQLRFRHHNE